MMTWGGTGRWRTRTVTPEHVGLTGFEYETLRRLEESGNPNADPPAPDRTRKALTVLYDRSLVDLDMRAESPAYFVTQNGRELLRSVGTFREPVPSVRRPSLETRAPTLVEWATYATLAAIALAIILTIYARGVAP